MKKKLIFLIFCFFIVNIHLLSQEVLKETKPDSAIVIDKNSDPNYEFPGYELSTFPDRTPRFNKSKIIQLASENSKINLPGDEYWYDQFSSLNAPNGGTWALGKSGNDIYVGGWFTAVGNKLINHIAKWDGNTWTSLGSGVDSNVYAIAIIGTNLYVGGTFIKAGGITTNYIAKWDGTSWSSLGGGVNGTVYALATDGINLYAGGIFTSAGGVANTSRIARWDGTKWNAMGTGVNSTVFSIVANGNDVYIGGGFTTASGIAANRVAKWNGSSWSTLSSGVNNTVYAMAFTNGSLFVGGDLTTAGGVAVNKIGKWNGISWSGLNNGTNDRITAITADGNFIYAGGWFTLADGVSGTNHIAKWDDTSWSALGSGVNDRVFNILANGNEIYVVGNLTTAGGKPSNYFAHWNPNPIVKYTISGSVTLGGSGIEGVIVSLKDSISNPIYTDTSDINGNYSFTANSGKKYSVTLAKTGYTFSPAFFAISNLTTNLIQNFNATLNTFTISGKITSGGTALSGVTVTRRSLTGNLSTESITDVNGLYSFTIDYGGSYIITPSKAGYTFNPASQSLSSISNNQVQNFTATLNTFTISGKITSSGTALSGVTITMIRRSLTGNISTESVTDVNGLYSFSIDYGGSYIITPSKAGYTFNPASQSFSSISNNQVQDFNAILQSIIVKFNDPNLEKEIRTALNKSSGDITDVNMLTLTSLGLDGKSIKNLSGLEYALNLIFLNLNINEVTDISPLKNLFKLTELHLSTNKITSVNSLSRLINLIKLNVNKNLLSNVDSLINLVKLTEITLDGNQIESIAGLMNMIKLETLHLWGNQISDLTPLQNLTSLKILTLHSNKLVNITPLQNLTNLVFLTLSGNNISDISPLNNFSQLSELYLSFNKISDINVIKNLMKLTNLDLTNNNLDDNDLTYLYPLKLLSNNNITTLINGEQKPGYLDLRQNSGFTEEAIRLLDAQLPLMDYNHILWDTLKTNILFNDANFESAVRRALNKPLGDINNIEMETLIRIIADNKGITDLTGIEYAKNLFLLDLKKNLIENIRPLENLTNIIYLNLDSNKISNLDALSNLINIENLSIRKNFISNIDSLSNMKKLKVLTAGWNIISSLNGIKNLSNLTEIHLWSNKLSDLTPLSNLTNLSVLYLQDNNISNIISLKNLVNLQDLGINGNNISDISVLADKIKLEILRLQNNSLSNISALKNLTNLTILDLQQNKISDISSLQNLINLQYLDLGENQIADVTPVTNLKNLFHLRLGGNRITNISALSELTNLVWLGLAYNQIEDITPLSKLTKLSLLYLSINKVKSIESLSYLTELDTLNLTNNQIIDIFPLSKLTKLTTLSIAQNQISDITAVAGMSALKELYLYNNQIQDINPISNLNDLTTIYLDSNKISDLAGIKGQTRIRNIGLTKNLLSDNSLPNLYPLKSISQIEDVVLINGVKKNGYLDLRSNIGFSEQAIRELDAQLPLLDYDHILWQPIVLQLRSPLNNSINISLKPSITWGSIQNVETYHLQISKDSLFANIMFNDSTIKDTSTNNISLDNNSKYYWHVRAKFIGSFIQWSGIWNFTTLIPAPNIPILLSPSNRSKLLLTNPVVSWNISGNAQTFRVQLAKDSLFNIVIFDMKGLTTTNHKFGQLSDNTLYFWRVKSNNSGGESDWSEVRSFATIIPSITFENDQIIAQPGESSLIKFQVSDTIPDKVKIFYKLGGDEKYDSALTTNIAQMNYSFNIPANMITPRGIDYYVKTSWGDIEKTTSPASIIINLKSLKSDQTFFQKKYSMMSLPVSIESKSLLMEIVRNIGSINNSLWRVFKWKNNQYEEYLSEDIKFVAGDGLWLISKNTLTPNFENCFTTPTYKPYKITLQPGWNQIGNPFLFAIPSSSVIIPNGSKVETTIWEWLIDDEQYNYLGQNSSLLPWYGYFIKNNETVPVDLELKPVYNGNSLSKMQSDISNLQRDEWKIEINIKEYPEVSNSPKFLHAELGCLKNSTDEWDMNDASEPPQPPAYFNTFINSASSLITFSHTEWKKFKGNYVKDFRESGKNGYIWDMEIMSNEKLKTTNRELVFQRYGSFPENFEIILYDLLSGTRSQLAQNNAYQIKSIENGVGKLKILVGTKEYLNVQLQKIEKSQVTNYPVPQYTLNQNYPNPFNPSTKIEYAIPENDFVIIKIFNHLGQELEILENSFKNSGKHSIEWNSKNYPSGVYYYKIQTSKFSDAKKMVLLK